MRSFMENIHKIGRQYIAEKHLKIEVFKAWKSCLDIESTAILRTVGNRLPVDTA
jgi:hypothetical protein